MPGTGIFSSAEPPELLDLGDRPVDVVGVEVDDRIVARVAA